MRLRYHKKHRLFNEVNVVPYIDVSLVLLLVFMISAPLIQQGVEVDLPKTKKASAVDSVNQEPIVITVDKNAKLYMNFSDIPNEPITTKEILTQVLALRKINPNLRVFVRGDRRALYANILQIMAILQNSGVEKVGLMTDSN